MALGSNFPAPIPREPEKDWSERPNILLPSKSLKCKLLLTRETLVPSLLIAKALSVGMPPKGSLFSNSLPL